MALPEYSMRGLLEAGVHFGHHTRRWNPKMSPYIFGIRNGIHIIDLDQTARLFARAYQFAVDTVARVNSSMLSSNRSSASAAPASLRLAIACAMFACSLAVTGMSAAWR